MAGYGDRLKLLRKTLGKTQAEFGDMLEINQVRLSRWEGGALADEAEKISKLRAYGVNLDWLLSGEGAMFLDEAPSETVRIRYPELSAAAGPGALNFEDLFVENYVEISRKIIELDEREIKDCFLIKVRGRSMLPDIEHGDLILVKSAPEPPRHAEGIYLVRYDNELYVKNIQCTEQQMIMRSLNKDFAPIVIENRENSDFKPAILGRIVLVIKQF